MIDDALLAPIDWVARWHALMRARRAQRRWSSPAATGDPWAHRAARLAQSSERLPADDPLLTRLRREVRPDDTVIDVGAGAGRYAVPLARLARRVVAVEPSATLRMELAARLAAAALTNVDIVPATWDAADVEPADVVVCSHVVYAIDDIVPFVRRLAGSATRTCLMTIRVGQQPGAAELWQTLYGVPRAPQPAFLDLYNLLASQGIVADVKIVPSAPVRYAELDEAVAEVRERMHLPAGDPDDDHLRALLAARLAPDPDGWLTWPGPVGGTAIIRWITPAPSVGPTR